MNRSLQPIHVLAPALLVLSLFLLAFQNYEIFLFSAFMGAVIGLILITVIVTDPDALRICWVLSAALLIGYAGGAVLTWLNATSSVDFDFAIKYRSMSLLSIALAVVYACCGITMLVGLFEAPCVRPDRLPRKTSRIDMLLPALVLLIILAAYINGDFGYGGIQVEESTNRISAFGTIADLCAAPTVGLCGYFIGRSRSKTERLIFASFALLTLVFIVPSGRRPILLALLILVIGLSLSGWLRRWRFRQLLLAAVSLGGFAYLGTSYFYALRLSGWELGPSGGLQEQMSLGLDFLVSPSLQDRFNILLWENIRERTFIIGYLADLIEATTKSAPLYGAAFIFYLRTAIPSALDPNKDEVLSFSQIETFVHPQLGLPVMDQANTILTDGVTDFGFLGSLIYLLGIILLLRAVFWLLGRAQAPVSCLFGALALIHLALKPEVTLAEYFSTIRNLALILPVLLGVEYYLNLGGANLHGSLALPKVRRDSRLAEDGERGASDL